MTFFQTCLYNKGVQVQLISDQKVPFAVTENQWVGFDNSDSVNTKVSIGFFQFNKSAQTQFLDMYSSVFFFFS